jgi:RNA polymerase sigma factor (TIGR02999 family)
MSGKYAPHELSDSKREILPSKDEEADNTELTIDQVATMWDELAILAKSVRRSHNQQGNSYRTSDVLLSALRRLTADAAKRWAEGTQLTWENRSTFFAAASTAMHRAIVDHVRRRTAVKRPSSAKRLPLDDAIQMAREDPSQLLDLANCLEKLAEFSPPLAEIVRHKSFAGLSNEDIGGLFGLSHSVVDRRWQKAKAFLAQCMDRAYGPSA